MPGPNFVLDKGMGVSAAIPQWYAVTQSAKESVVVAASAGALVFGICQENILSTDLAVTAAKRRADIRVMGISRCVVDAAYSIGTRLRTAADGRLTALAAATANQNQVGILLVASAAANDQADVFLTPGVQITVP